MNSPGAKAADRLPLPATRIETLARAFASELGIAAGGAGLQGKMAEHLAAVVHDLQAHRGSSVVISGDHQPPTVHALAHAMNQALGNVGRTVVYTDPVDANPINQTESLKELVADMRAGKVDLLIIL